MKKQTASKKRTSQAPVVPKSQQNTYNKYVTKYKRTKNLVKKCVEISEQCQLDIILVIKDKNSDRCREFHTSQELTVPSLVRALESNESQPTLRYERIFASQSFGMDE